MKIFIVLSLILSGLYPQDKFDLRKSESPSKTEIAGKVFDLGSGEALAGASITLIGSNETVMSGFDGEFVLSIPEKESYSLRIEYISYQEKIIRNIQLKDLKNLQIGLNEKKDLILSGPDMLNSNT